MVVNRLRFEWHYTHYPNNHQSTPTNCIKRRALSRSTTHQQCYQTTCMVRINRAIKRYALSHTPTHPSHCSTPHPSNNTHCYPLHTHHNACLFALLTASATASDVQRLPQRATQRVSNGQNGRQHRCCKACSGR